MEIFTYEQIQQNITQPAQQQVTEQCFNWCSDQLYMMVNNTYLYNLKPVGWIIGLCIIFIFIMAWVQYTDHIKSVKFLNALYMYLILCIILALSIFLGINML